MPELIDHRTHWTEYASRMNWLPPCIVTRSYGSTVRPEDVNCPVCLDALREEGHVFPGDRWTADDRARWAAEERDRMNRRG